MSTSSSPQPDAARTPSRRLKLTTNTTPPPPGQARPDATVIKDESSSPTRPSYSPVTPVLSQATLQSSEAQWITEPEPLPVSLDENPDAIALRATLSILQMQRQQSLRDIRNLDIIRQEAMKDPRGFVDDLKAGRLSRQVVEDDDDDDTAADVSDEGKDESRVATIPVAQNVVRCPPIEWSKYRINGEALDTLHDVQRMYPGISDEDLAGGSQPQPHEIAAPYRAFIDKLSRNSADSKELRKHDA